MYSTKRGSLTSLNFLSSTGTISRGAAATVRASSSADPFTRVTASGIMGILALWAGAVDML
jgi:hypothetical protein